MKIPCVILGLGKTGLSFVRYCLYKNINCIVIDDAQLNVESIIELKKLEQLYAKNIPCYFHPDLVITKKLIAQSHTILTSPGLALNHPLLSLAAQYQKNVLTDLDLFLAEIDNYKKNKIIAITGSNGKSTVTTLTGFLLKKLGYNTEIMGNIGVPVLDCLLNNIKNNNINNIDFYVIELSSAQLARLSVPLNAEVATILNLCDNHLDYHPNFEHYKNSKKQIYLNCKNAVIYRHDLSIYPDLSNKNNTIKNIITFGEDYPEKNNFGLDNNNLYYGDELLINTEQLILNNTHQALNILAALSIIKLLTLDFRAAVKFLPEFSGLPHRCELINIKNNIQNIKFINDSKSTNPTATLAAINSFSNYLKEKNNKNNYKNIILIMGGMAKNADFSILAPSLIKFVKLLILIGRDALYIENSININNKNINIIHAEDLKNAVLIIKNNIEPNDIALLSPGCASYDQFKNFEDRGAQFTQLIREIY